MGRNAGEVWHVCLSFVQTGMRCAGYFLCAMLLISLAALPVSVTAGYSNDVDLAVSQIPATVPGACLTVSCSGLGQDTPDWPSVHGVQTNRLLRDGVASSCASPKACPGPYEAGNRAYDAYTFTNSTGGPLCVDMDLTVSCASHVFLAVYLDSYNPSDVCANYLADSGSSSSGGATVALSFTLAAGQSAVAVVHVVTVGSGCPEGYVITLNQVCPVLTLHTPDYAVDGCPGTVVTYPFTLTNRTGGSATFDLTHSGNNWPVSHPATVGPIADGASANFDVTHTIPAGTAPGLSDSYTVTATDQVVPGNTVSTYALTAVTDMSGMNEYALPTPGSGPFGITSGPDGNLWFTEAGMNQIGRITPGGVVTEFPIPTAGSVPYFITSGPDGNLWFTENSGNNIGRITPAGVVTEFALPTAGAGPVSIVSGPDGNLWFSEANVNQIGRITTSGVVVEFPVPTVNSYPYDITSGPDGNLWFTEYFGNNIGRITPAGVVSEFAVPAAGAGPVCIVSGSDGNLWFTEIDGNQIGRITPAGSITEFPVMTGASLPYGITSGPDSSLWFAANGGNRIGRITQVGVVTEFPIPTTGSFPVGIASGPDGNLWFTENGGNQIGQLAFCPGVRVTPSSMPGGTMGSAYSQTVTASGGTAPYTFALTAGALPPGLTLTDNGDGTATVSGIPATVGGYNFTVTATDANMDLGSRAYTILVCSTITLAPASLPDGVAGSAYSQPISASGGTAPYTYSVTAGTLPPGLTLSPDGQLAGTPYSGGVYSFTVTATDGIGCTGNLAYSLFVCHVALSPGQVPAIDTTPSWNGSENICCFGNNGDCATLGQTIIAPPGGATLTSFSFFMNVDPVAVFRGEVYEWNGSRATGAALFESAPMSTPGSGAFHEILFNTGGVPLVGGQSYVLFASVSRDPGSGSGSWGFLGAGAYASGDFVYTCNGSDPSLWTSQDWGIWGTEDTAFKVTFASIASLPQGEPGTPYSQTITALGGTAPYSFSVTAGLLPPGLTLSPDGLLSGIPTLAGSYAFTVTATDQNGCTGSQEYTLSICQAISLSPASLPDGAVGVAYDQPISASGGTSPYTYAVTAGTLPPGLTLSSDGQLAGTTITAGTYNFTVTATDSNSCAGSIDYEIFVACPATTVTPASGSIFNTFVGGPFSQQMTLTGLSLPLSWTLESGTLPSGFMLMDADTLTPSIMGPFTEAGSFTFTIRATDAYGCFVDITYTLMIALVPGPLPQAQRDALIALYNSTNGAGWNNRTNWRNFDDTDFNAPGTEWTWYGVTTNGDNSCVTSINLDNNHLVGTLPTELGVLSCLTTLWLSWNQISGSIPSEIGNLSSLQNLVMAGNQLTGGIPVSLGNLQSLMYLDLNWNPLGGTIPSELGNMTALVDLRLGGDQLTGSIPSELQNDTSLERIYLSQNQFTGSLPAWLGSLSNLREITIESAQLSGPIPAELGNLANLQQLNLGGNPLTGSIPPEFGALTNLTYLSLYYDQLTGSIPPELGNLSNLTSLYLPDNGLSGPIPPQLGNLSNLWELNVSNNQLSGSLPPEIGGLTNLGYLYLYNNSFTGQIPPEIGNMQNLRGMWLDGNQFGGPLPSQIGNLPFLNYIFLQNNRITGNIPSEFGNLTNLRYLWLYGNRLSGNIPASLINLTNLYNNEGLHLRWNALHTSDPALLAFLNQKQSGGDWESTQTIAPANLAAGLPGNYTVPVSWNTILYTGDTGGYNVYYSETSGGPYTLFGSAADKLATNLTVTGLTPGTTYYFVAQSFTEPHGNNQNLVESELSLEASATTTCAPDCTASANPSVGTVPLFVQFAAEAPLPGNCTGTVAYDWDFGDGSPHSAEQNPGHTYLLKSVYNWTLTATNGPYICVKTGQVGVYDTLDIASLGATDICPGTGGGNGDGVLDPGETLLLTVTAGNFSASPVTNVRGHFTCTTPGVSIVNPDLVFPDLAPGATSTAMGHPVKIVTAPGLACGLSIPFDLQFTSDQGSWTSSFLRETGPVCRNCSVASFAPSPVPSGADGDGAAATARKSNPAGTSIAINYDSSKCKNPNYNIYYGAQGNLPNYKLSGSRVGIGNSGSFTWSGVPAVPAGERFIWWVIVGTDNSETEGSWGKSSQQMERHPAPSDQCGFVIKDASAACP